MRPILLLLVGAAIFDLSQVHAEEVHEAAVQGVNDFAVAHHRLVKPGNVLVSPWSVQNTLAMLAAGADGSTREAMQKALFLGDDEKARNAAFQSLRQLLTAKPEVQVPLEIRSSNRLFVEKRLQLVTEWQTAMREVFQAEAGLADFSGDADGERGKINQWVKDETKGKIPEIIPAGGLDAQTLIVLVNALYFDMPWDEQFTKELTTQQPFWLDSARFKTVPLMFKQHAQRYARKEGFQIATLPYAGDVFQFVVFVPDAVDGLAVVEKQLTGALLTECARLPRTELRLSMPRLKLAPEIFSLKQTLTAMGAGELFEVGKANLSRMIADADRLQPYVSNVFHRTFMEMDEDGTKAAAVTSGVVRYKNGAPREIRHQVVKADRPFLFMIQHVATGTCLFLGRVNDPAPDVAATAGAPPSRGPAKK
jgi:serpin B